MRNSSRPWAATLAIIGLMVATGCGVVWDAPDVDMVVQRDSIKFAQAREERELVGGETVITVINDDGANKVQIVLAKHDSEELPPDLLEAESPRDDDRIVGMTPILDARDIEQQGVYAYDRDAHRFHFYLDPDETYVLFDRLGGVDRGVVKVLHPYRPDGE